MLGYGIVALLIMLAFPDGVVGSLEKMRRRHRLRERIGGIAVDRLFGWSGRRAAATQGTAITVTGARKQFGSLAALGGVDLTVARGHVHGLVGPNGSGKTTLLNVVSGLIPLDAGSVRIGGTDTTRAPAYRVARLGVGRTFQTPRVFEDMSIWENIEIGADVRAAETNDLLDLLAPFRDEEWAGHRPDLLAHAQRRSAGGAERRSPPTPISCCSTNPPRDCRRRNAATSASWCVSCATTSARPFCWWNTTSDLVWRVADRITVLDAGLIVAEGPPEEIAADPRVRALFTGTIDA